MLFLLFFFQSAYFTLFFICFFLHVIRLSFSCQKLQQQQQQQQQQQHQQQLLLLLLLLLCSSGGEPR
jgi:fucose permease